MLIQTVEDKFKITEVNHKPFISEQASWELNNIIRTDYGDKLNLSYEPCHEDISLSNASNMANYISQNIQQTKRKVDKTTLSECPMLIFTPLKHPS